MYKVHLPIILASEGLAVYRERKKKKGKTRKKKNRVKFKNSFSTFIEPASSRNVLKSSRTFLEHLKRKHVITRWMMGKTWLEELEGKCGGS